jgi:hypothetical protein
VLYAASEPTYAASPAVYLAGFGDDVGESEDTELPGALTETNFQDYHMGFGDPVDAPPQLAEPGTYAPV